MTFALLSISTIVSQYIFTDAFPLSNNKLLIYGILLLSFSYTVMALYPKISVYYLAIIVNGLGGGGDDERLCLVGQWPPRRGSCWHAFVGNAHHGRMGKPRCCGTDLPVVRARRLLTIDCSFGRQCWSPDQLLHPTCKHPARILIITSQGEARGWLETC